MSHLNISIQHQIQKIIYRHNKNCFLRHISCIPNITMEGFFHHNVTKERHVQILHSVRNCFVFLDNTIVHSFQVKGSVLCRQNCQVCFLEQFSMQEKPSNTSHISDHLNSIPAVLKMSTDQTFKTTLKHQILTCYINVFCSRAHKHAINSFRTVVFAW